MLLYYIRHGEPTYDPDELTPNGRRQAEAVGRRLARFGLDKIYCSTSNRALQTAQPTREPPRSSMESAAEADEKVTPAMLLPMRSVVSVRDMSDRAA